MDFKLVLHKKQLKQIQLAKMLGTTPAVISLQINRHQMLPVRFREKFCEIMGISQSELERAMAEGSRNE
jgi:hypothetical protein